MSGLNLVCEAMKAGLNGDQYEGELPGAYSIAVSSPSKGGVCPDLDTEEAQVAWFSQAHPDEELRARGGFDLFESSDWVIG